MKALPVLLLITLFLLGAGSHIKPLTGLAPLELEVHAEDKSLGFPGFYAWHGVSYTTQVQNDANRAGSFRYISLSIYGDPNSPLYAAVVVAKEDPSMIQHRYFNLTVDGFQTTFNNEAKLNFAPRIIVATGSAGSARFAAVFEHSNTGIPYTRHTLTTAQLQDFVTMAKKLTLIPTWFASYGDNGDPRYITILGNNQDLTVWNVDGLVETASQYQARFNAQTSAWCRPMFVSVNYDAAYSSLFVDNVIGGWIARHEMTASDYQNAFDTYGKQSYWPIYVQGGGSGNNIRYSAIFAPQLPQVIPKQFTANCPVPYGPIDTIIQKAMTNSPLRHASLSIVKGSKLVYTCAYTYGEKGYWPLATPTTKFRMASVSKTVTALALFQALEKGTITLNATLQSLMPLTQADGHSGPADGNFPKITVQNLLEHKSGVKPGGWDYDPNVLQYWQMNGPGSYNFPTTEKMQDSYIADQPLDWVPGTVQVYNNAGYYLLGRLLAKLSNTDVISAVTQTLLKPLQLTHFSATTPVIPSNEGNPLIEARYRGQDLPVADSVATPQQPPVADGYGNYGLLSTKLGSGGMAGTTVELARLASLLIYQQDTYPCNVYGCSTSQPILKRSTITKYLNMAVNVLAQPGAVRAGYGFDGAYKVGSTQYHLQKGGSLSDSNNVFQINGDWGFVLNWAGPPVKADADWYPDYPEVMAQAQAYFNDSSPDLFGQFGIYHP